MIIITVSVIAILVNLCNNIVDFFPLFRQFFLVPNTIIGFMDLMDFTSSLESSAGI
jgi:hypothetical protein